MKGDDTVLFNGETVTILALCEQHGVSLKVAQTRRLRGHSVIDACTRPIAKSKRQRSCHPWCKFVEREIETT